MDISTFAPKTGRRAAFVVPTPTRPRPREAVSICIWSMEKIDFVVTWLDSSDPVWQQQFEHYKPGAKGDMGKGRYREMNIFPYWFRAVERYAPWVNKVYLVTNGTFPRWIDPDHPKLVLVRHDEYIPKEMLPTFNSCTIELHFHRIKGLSERFVYFNDDILLNGPVTPEYFFKDGLPCDTNKETCFNVPIYTRTDRFSIYMSLLANLGIVNAHFNRWQTVCQSPRRWFGPHLGLKGLLMSSILLKQRLFVGFSNNHIEQAYLKSSFEDAWEKEPEFLESSCTRFREDVIANPYLFRYWQLAQNKFYPMKRRFATFHFFDRSVAPGIEKALFDPGIATICLNDSTLCPDDDYEYLDGCITRWFAQKFPEKSSFERT